MNPEPATVVSVSEIVTTRRCGAPKTNGAQCANPNLSWFEGTGWRCPFHMPTGAAWPSRLAPSRAEPADRPIPTDVPNDGRITNIKTALDMIAWATENLASGALAEARARGVINGARQYMRGIATTTGAEQMDAIEKGMVGLGGLPKQK